nr:MAG TPA: chromosomal replication initiator protein [Bacteriophage sp.]
MYPSQIAVHIHKTKRAVNYMISNFRERMEGGKMLRIYWENIRKSLGNN